MIYPSFEMKQFAKLSRLPPRYSRSLFCIQCFVGLWGLHFLQFETFFIVWCLFLEMTAEIQYPFLLVLLSSPECLKLCVHSSAYILVLLHQSFLVACTYPAAVPRTVVDSSAKVILTPPPWKLKSRVESALCRFTLPIVQASIAPVAQLAKSSFPALPFNMKL